MAAETPYDATLTGRIRSVLEGMGAPGSEEETELARLVARLEGEFRALISEPSRRVRTFAFLQSKGGEVGSRVGPRTTGRAGPIRGTLSEMAALSLALDQSTDASEGFGLAESVAHRAHELVHTVEGFFSALDPAATISEGFRRLAALLGQLIQNAVAKMRAFARLLNVSSFAITFGTAPPQLSVTFTFGGP